MSSSRQVPAEKVVVPLPKTIRRRRTDESDPQAEAIRDLAAAIREATEAFQPAADTVHGFAERLDALCDWLKAKGPWVLGATPAVLVAIQAISPEAAKVLAKIIAAFGS